MAQPDDITRYVRCNMLVGHVLTPLVRKYMQLNKVLPASVYNLILQRRRFREKLSPNQMSVIQTLQSDDYEKFDITLMYKIAREKCFGLIIKDHPTRKWGSVPVAGELTIGDDIERIRLCRDKIMHNPNHIVSESEQNDLFDEFIEVGKRADIHLNLKDESSYEQQVRDLQNRSIDPESTRKLNESCKENEELKEMVQLQRFRVFMDRHIEVYIEDIRRGDVSLKILTKRLTEQIFGEEPLDGKKHIQMVINGLSNSANLAETINDRREEINSACKDCLIELDKACEGSLILYLEVQNKIFKSDDLFHAEMDRFVEILFQVISFKSEISTFSYLLILLDESYLSDSSSDDEEEDDISSEEIYQKKLVLDLTVQNKVFQTDESLQQNLNSFVEAVVTDMNGQQIKKGNSMSAIFRLHESECAKSSQDVLICGLCEVDKRITVKCVDCDLFLCQRCQDKAHAKFKDASFHDIVPLKDVHSHDKMGNIKTNFTPVKCNHHNTKLCCIYCVTCRQLVCEVCIKKNHEMHNTEELATFCHNRVKKMKTIYSQTRYEFEEIIFKLRTMHEVQTENYSAMNNLLLKEKEMAINQINAKYEKLLSRYKVNTKKCLELMSVKETAFLTSDESAHTILNEIETSFESKDIYKFLGASEKLETFFRNYPSKLLEDGYAVCVQHFVQKQFNFQIFSETHQTEIKIKPKGLFKCDMSRVKTITSDQDGNIWIADNKHNIKQLKMRENINTLKSKQLDVPIEEIRCLRNNEIIFTSSTKIMRLTSDEVSEFTDFDPYEPSTIHVSNENEIIVGFYHYKTDETRDKSVLMRLELNGEIKQVYRNHECQLLRNEIVRSCTTLANRNISYVDSYKAHEGNGRVVNINNAGIVLWKYHGNPVFNVENHPFYPVEILTTKSNNLLISDKHEGALHILTSVGSLLAIVDVTHMGLSKTCTMTIDISDILWINSQPRNRNSLCAFEYSGF